MEEQSDHPVPPGPKNSLNDQKKQNYPENYGTCIDFRKLMFGNVVSALAAGM